MRLSDKIRNHSARVAVMGQGYVGLPLAMEFAKVGFCVAGVDLDEEKVAALNRGESYIPDKVKDIPKVVGGITSECSWMAALDVIKELQRKGAWVCYADPFVSSLAHEGLEVQRVEVTAEGLRGCDAALILTDHREFDYHLIVQQADLIIDARNATRGLTVPDTKVIRL